MTRLPRAWNLAIAVLATSCAVASRNVSPIVDASRPGADGVGSNVTAASGLVGVGPGLPVNTLDVTANLRDLSGRVVWPQARTVQAAASTVINQATVSLIDLNSGTTVASGLTDAAGNFSLNLGTFGPTVGQFYILEAVKGLRSQGPGAPAVRLRTLLQASGSGAQFNGWTSITSNSTSSAPQISTLTTAIAILVGLGKVPPANVINTVSTSAGYTGPNPLGTVSSSTVTNLATLVRDHVTDDRDPVEETSEVTPAITTLSSVTVKALDLIEIRGKGFVSSPGKTTVTFGSVSATPTFVGPAAIYVQVPANVAPGAVNVTVSTPTGTSGAASLTVTSPPVILSGVSASPRRGYQVTILGSGFTTPATTNAVRFTRKGGGTITPPAADYIGGDSNSLTVKIPLDADPGILTVVNGAGVSSAPYQLAVSAGIEPTVSYVWPNTGASFQTVTLKGSNFGDAGSIKVNGIDAQVEVWQPTLVRFRVPFGIGSGASTIEVNNNLQGRAMVNWTALNGNVVANGWTNAATLPYGVGWPPCNLAVSGQRLYIIGGNNRTNVCFLNLGADGSPQGLDTNVATMPYGINSADIKGNNVTLVGNRAYGFDEDNTNNACYLEFSLSTGLHSVTVADTPVPGASFNEASQTAGPRGIYVGGGYTGVGCWWKTYDPFTNSWSGWQGPRNLWKNQSDASFVVLGNRLWYMSYEWQGYADLDSSGNIVSNFTYTGGSPFGGYPVQMMPVGSFMYSVGPWCSNNFYRTQISGASSYTNSGGGWSQYGAINVGLSNSSMVSVGRYVYAVGGDCGSAQGNVFYTTLN
ncbi:MAG: IPT/TIG domain-containing protein [bacterium]|nr:IPT/TIG domain-containing protein [bacterium]